MDSVDTFPHQLHLQRVDDYASLHFPRRSLSPKEEKDALIRKIELLMAENLTLEEKQSNLNGTIYDLRKLLNVVGKESAEEVEFFHKRNQELKEEVSRLSNGLKYSHKNGKHLNRCAQYWGQFLQQ